MGAAYSEDIRLRVLSAIDGGMSKMAAHRTFRVARSTIDDWFHLRAHWGSVAVVPSVRRGPAAKIADLEQFESFATRHRHKTLRQMTGEWQQEMGTPVSHNTLSLAMKRIGWTRKKRVGSTQSVWGPALP